MSKIYAGIDLHSTNCYVGMIDEENKTVYKKRLSNDLNLILKVFKLYQDCIEGIVIESTYNWYWLADGLQEAGYNVKLANTGAIIQYSGLKHIDDEDDALWLANMLRLNILRSGYIYPKEQRGVRELLRKRLILVQQQTACLLSIQGTITRYENIKLSAKTIKSSEIEKTLKSIQDKNVTFAVKSQLRVLNSIMDQVYVLEKQVQKMIKMEPVFKLLKTVPGIGLTLAMTIFLETGDINRFKSAGNYASYCRCVGSKKVSNNKKKGENNRKNGNAYLCWAFIEASNHAIQSYPEVKKYYQKKLNKTKRVVALKTLANKISKACYFIMRDKVEFDMKKLFV